MRLDEEIRVVLRRYKTYRKNTALKITVHYGGKENTYYVYKKATKWKWRMIREIVKKYKVDIELLLENTIVIMQMTVEDVLLIKYILFLRTGALDYRKYKTVEQVYPRFREELVRSLLKQETKDVWYWKWCILP